MCGIAGFLLASWQLSKFDAESMAALATRMARALTHRGPDDHGVWLDSTHGLALSHRRLSILDLSPEGHQPMHSATGRYVLSYNGEIYNHRDLRAQLEYPWRGTSDTETLLAAFECWGVEETLTAINGMFAFAVWDRHTQTLTLARDRMGEKPLYYGWMDGRLLFASEPSAIRAALDAPPSINREALYHLLRNSYIPAPLSIYQGIHKLPPASYMQWQPGTPESPCKRYWHIEEVAAHARQHPLALSDNEAVAELDRRMKAVVGARMMADVPLGAFLSGGVDSSSIVALMQAQSLRPIRTFTIGFQEFAFNEAPYAKAVARHLATDHNELYVSAKDALQVIPKLASIYSEPFADASQIPSYLVSAFARQNVTVALSGDGGDELFGGYTRYLKGPALWHTAAKVPLPIRRAAIHGYLHAYQALLRHLPGHRTRQFADRAEGFLADSPEAFYRYLCATNPHADALTAAARMADLPARSADTPFAEWMMLADSLTYFPDDILTKVDRAAMASSLETRTPFTDPELIYFGWQLPQAMKLRHGEGKWLLRQMLYRYVPQTLLDRPKTGFSVPLAQWLRGPLRDWAADLLNRTTLHQQGFIHIKATQRLWRQHQSGERDHAKALWNILMFQSWLSHQ